MPRLKEASKKRVVELNATKAAEFLGVSRRRFDHLKNQNAFTKIRIGAVVHYMSDELELFRDRAGWSDEVRIAAVRNLRRERRRPLS